MFPDAPFVWALPSSRESTSVDPWAAPRTTVSRPFGGGA